MKLFLVGYMGCGKSTLGRRVAKEIGVRFVDLDTVVEAQDGAKIGDIFKYEGEEAFRQMEREAAEALLVEQGDMVVATGGGFPTWRDNMQLLNANGISIFLDRSAGSIAARLSPYGIAKRPKLKGLSGESLAAFIAEDIASRMEYYKLTQHQIVCDNTSDEQIRRQIIDIITKNE